MSKIDIVQERLNKPGIAHPRFDTPDAAAAWMGAVQAQDYASALWAVGLRCDADATAIEQAIAHGAVVRTWLLRGTLHFVAGADVRWMLALLAPRLIAASARRNGQLGLDDGVLARSFDAFAEALHGGKQLTRAGMLDVLEQAGVSTQGQRGYHLLRHAGLNGLICFGPMQGKQETFVLLEERIPAGDSPQGDEALAEVAVHYFRSHGPATLQDFVWWSGLRVGEARSAIEHAGTRLRGWTIGDESYWSASESKIDRAPAPSAHLLPAFDEYYLGYRDRSAVLDPAYDSRVVSSNGIFRPVIAINGQIAGIWRKTRKADAVTVTLEPFRDFTAREHRAVAGAAKRYGAFLSQQIVVT